MFYEPTDGHGLRYDPFKALIAPRPIGWISTVNTRGIANLAPYSFFNAMSASPHMVGFASIGFKHSITNAKETREFVFNVVSLPLARQMNESSAGVKPDESEFELADIDSLPCRIVKPPRVAKSPASMECKLVHFHEFTDLEGRPTDRYLVVGQVVGVHIDEQFLTDGRFDSLSAQMLARCGYRDYSVLENVFEMDPPDEAANLVGNYG